ncbi:MAG: SUMF1/EgtB/PvdO family nonheme iron enzyme, partial [Phycisphaerales bacterium]|nr:SUMF1/EgtB/PvdO family nonheme iron enzyme [Phycisphaerales bacterium]
ANTRGIARWSVSTSSWSALGSGVDGAVFALAALPGGDVVAGGDFTTAGGVANTRGIARWSVSTSSWSALGSGNDSTVQALAVLPNGDVVAGGAFTTAGGLAASRLARWNAASSSWSALGSGVNSEVSALVALPNGDLVAGGDFTTAGGSQASRVARWNASSSSWSTLGSGMNSTVNALTSLPNGDLVAGGAFSTAGGLANTRGIARWNASSSAWSALGSGMNSDVYAVAVLPNGDMVAGGNFTSAVGVADTRFIARWNSSSSSWSALGSGMNNWVFALAILPNGDLVAGGDFTTAGGSQASRVARWSASTLSWSALGSGMDGRVRALAALPNGDLVAGGDFTSAVGVANTRGIARWNASSSSWSALGSGMDGSVRALTVLPNGDLVAGGAFTSAGGVAASRIARWNASTSSWSVLGSGVDGTVQALAALPNGDLVASGFYTTSGSVVTPFLARLTGAPWVLAQPSPRSLILGQTIQVSATPIAGLTGLSVQWQRNGVNIASGAGGASSGGGTVSGASGVLPSPTVGAAAVLTITGAQVSDSGSYTAVFTNTCGTVTTIPALVNVAVDRGVTGRDFRAKYGQPLWVQTIGTGFGDSTLGNAQTASGSEIDAVYARIEGGRLFVGFSGNLETNGNSAVLAVNYGGTGGNVLSLPSGGGLTLSPMNGLTFDTGFVPQLVLAYSAPVSGSPTHSLQGAINGTSASVLVSNLRSGTSPITASLLGGQFQATVDNSNIAGVRTLGASFAGPPQDVDTGVEFSIPLTTLGWDGVAPVRLAGFINGPGNNYLSNQVVGGLPAGRGNLGGDGNGGFTGNLAGVNFNSIPGNQYVTFVTIPTVTIGNPGNAADPLTGFGSVPYTYNIGTTEVTNAQYAQFLNAVAATDTNGLYNTNMAGSFGGITRSGSPGSYTYAVVAGRANNPVNYVSFWDACRYANWLHNGQPAGPQSASTTEDGAYTLTPAGVSGNTIARNAGWQWAVTSENEWYKAAYHQPANQGGPASNYWLYPTSSNTITTAQANYNDVIGNTTPVGSYAANFYGTFDMGGNVWEWNEEIFSSQRGIRGGSFSNSADGALRSSIRFQWNAADEIPNIGMRVSRSAAVAPAAAPNLLVATANGPTGDVIAIDPTASVPFTYTAQNIGPGPVPGTAAWVDAAYLSLDTTIDGGDFRVPVSRTGPVSVNGIYSGGGTFTGVPPATYNLILRVNDNGALDEGGLTGNNTLVSPTLVRVVAPVIDLAVAAPQVSPLPVLQLWPVTVSAQVTATGTNVASSCRGRLILVDSSQPGVQNRQTVLTTATLNFTGTGGAGATQTLTFSGLLPVTVSPPATFVAIIDQLSSSARNDNPVNNSASTDVAVVSSPDLAVESIGGDTSIVQGLSASVSFTVRNVSTTALPASAWSDRVYLSVDNVPSPDDVQVSIAQGRSLAANGAYTVNATVANAAQLAPAEYFVIVVANVNGSFPEAGSANNTLVRSAKLTVVARPNLRPTGVTLPGGTDLPQGSSVAVRWTDFNDGPGAAAGPWTDRVVLSKNTVFGDSDDRPFPGGPAGPTSLAAGSGVSVEQSIAVPINASLPPDTYNLFVQTNVGGVPLETNPNDNVSAPVQVRVVRPPAPNLVAAPPTGPAEAIGGRTVQVAWRTDNLGDAAATGPWTTRVYLSKDRTLNTGGPEPDVLLDEFSVRPPTIVLGPTQSTTQAETVTLPKVVGDRYLIVWVNPPPEAVQEYLDTADNIAAATSAIAIKPEPLPDLTVPSVSPLGGSGGAAVFSGTTVNATFRVLNDNDPNRPDSATGATSTPVWFDRLYLSRRPVRDGSERPLSKTENQIFLRPGESYTQNVQVKLPDDLFGPEFYLIATTDEDNAVTETTKANNLGVSPMFPIQLPKQPDLIAGGVGSPLFNLPTPTAATGQPIQVTWTETNSTLLERSGGDTPAVAWATTVYLSTNADPTPPGPLDVTLGISVRPIATPLLAGASDPQRSATFVVPPGTSGANYYIKVLVDSDNKVTERTLENNNVAVTPRTLQVVRTAPNLVPTRLLPNPSALPGNLLLASYTVESRGDDMPGGAQWRDRLWLSADRTIDPSADFLLTPDVPRATANLGPIDGSDSKGYVVTQSYRLPRAIPPGRYWLALRTNADNTVDERSDVTDGRLDNDLFSAAQVEVRAEYADLAVSTPSAALITAAPGASVRIDWTVTNAGDAPTPVSAWTDAVLLSSDGTPSAGDTSLAGVARSGVLAPGASYSVSRVVVIPGGTAASDYFIVVRADSGGEVLQKPAGGLPDFVAIPLRVTPDIADLRVASVAASPKTLVGGQRLTVDWTVTNAGTRATIGNTWADRVVVRGAGGGTELASTEVGRSGALAPQAVYQRQAQFDLPLGADGAFDVIVTTDSRGSIPEGDKTNNSGSDSISVTAAPPANLVAQAPQIPASVDAGRPFDVTWTVRNESDQATNAAVWDDELWLSRDGTIDGGDTRLLVRTVSGGLGPRSSYPAPQTATVTMPAGASGSYRVLLRTDARGQVYERGVTADNVAASAGLVSVGTANLVPTAVNPAVSTISAGRDLSVTWSARNTGHAAVPVPAWRDAVYLSRNQALDSGDVLLGTLAVSGPLPGGSPYTTSASFRLPAALSGPYFVIVRVNSDRSVPEPGGEGDNVLASSTLVDVTLPDPPDLIVTDVLGPPSAQLGLPALFSWRVGNAATARGVLAGSWEDSVFLSKDPVWDPGDTFVGRFPITANTPINPGDSLPRQASPSIPPAIPGPYYAVVRGDSRRFLSQVDATPGNDDSTSPAAFPVTIAEIAPPGEFVSSTLFTTGAERYFAIRPVAPGQTLRVSFRHDSPQALAELYVGRDAIPTSGSFDFAFDRPGDPAQQVIVPLTDRDTYYVLARAAGPAQPPSGVVRAEYLPFQILGVSPTSVGAGEVSIRVRGAQMPVGTVFRLIPQGGGADVLPLRVTSLGIFDFLLTFDLTGRPGTYSLNAAFSGQTSTFATPVSVSPATSAWLAFEVAGVTTAKIGKPVAGQITAVNSGNVDVQVGELIASLPRIGSGAATLTLFPDDPARRAVINSVGATDLPIARRLFLGRLAPQQLVTIPYALTFNAPVPGGMGIAIGGQSRTRAEYGSVITEAALAAADQFQASLLSSGVDPAAAQAAGGEFVSLALAGYQAALSPTGGAADEVGALVWGALAARPRPDAAFFAAWMPDAAARVCAARFCPPAGPCDVCTLAIQSVRDVLACVGCIPAIDTTNIVAGGLPIRLALDGCSGLEALSRDGSGRVLRRALPGECWPAPVASYDPNQITGPGKGDLRWISPRRKVNFAITFQNEPAATSPASKVEVTTPMPSGLQTGGYRGESVIIGSIEQPVLGNAFAGLTTLPNLPTESGDPVSSKVSTTVRPSSGGGFESYWQLITIDPSISEPPSNPFSGFLPRESPTLSGTGTVRFSVSPAPLPTGTRFETFANIVFDDNPPIRTNTVFNTIDSDDPVSSIDPGGAPPRALDGRQAFMTFSASDVGSGLEGVRVLVSTDGGPYRIFQPLTGGSSAVFDEIQPGHVYGFATQAVDIASNVEPLPLTPDAVTVVPTIKLDPASDTGQPGDLVTGVTTPTFNIVSIPSENLPVEIRSGGSVVVSGLVSTDARGRGAFTVPAQQALVDGPYTIRLLSDAVVTSVDFTIASFAPQIQRWTSIRPHGVLGEIALPLPAGLAAIEPRRGGLAAIDIALTSAIDPATVSPASLRMVAVDPAGVPIDLSSNLVGVSVSPDQRRIRAVFTPSLSKVGVYCIQLADVRSPSGTAVVPGPGISVGVLPADVTGDARTNANDFAVVRAVAAQLDGAPIDPSSLTQVRADVDANGVVDAADVALVRASRGADLRGVGRPCGTIVLSPAGESPFEAPIPAAPAQGGVAVASGPASPLGGALGGRAAFGSASRPLPPGPAAPSARATEPLGPALARVFDTFDHPPVRLRGLLAVLDRTARRDAAAVATIAAVDAARVTAAPAAGWWIVDIGEGGDERRARSALENQGLYTSPLLAAGPDVQVFIVPRVIARPATSAPAPTTVARAASLRGLRDVRLVGGMILAEAGVLRAEDLASAIDDLLDAGGITSVEPDLGLIAPAPILDRAPASEPIEGITPIVITCLGLEAQAPSAALVAVAGDLAELGVIRCSFQARGALAVARFAAADRTLVFASDRLAELARLADTEPGVLLDTTSGDAPTSPAARAALRRLLSAGWLVTLGGERSSAVLGPSADRPVRTATPAATAAAAAAVARALRPQASADEVVLLLARSPLTGAPPAIDPARVARAARPQADLDGDGRVSTSDLVVLQRLVESGDLRRADLNGDGRVDEEDFVVVLSAMR